MFSCTEQIQYEIDLKGAMPFDRFMELALYGVPNGYYRRENLVIGASGDFITAPEISPLYSHCFARCFQELETGSSILEFGAGTGRLAADCLQYLSLHNALPKKYFILELSAQLAQQQRQTISEKNPELLNHVEWLSALPDEFAGMIIANEILDAMPVKQFRVQQRQFAECFVNYNKDGFYYEFVKSTAFNSLPDSLLEIEGYQSEVNLHIQPWLDSLSQLLTRGVIYLIDYGFPRHEYYNPTRFMGTLMCHHQHKAHANPFVFVGDQDITAHVDFTAVAESAVNVGLNVAGYTNQASFLINCNILSELNDNLQQSNALKKLTLPHEMGELFKVMALTKDDFNPLGFNRGDQRHKL